MVDLVQWFMMPLAKAGLGYSRETHHLEGVKLDGVTPAEKEFHVDTGYSLWFVKDQQGYPWDVKPYDSQFIYDRVTELNWNHNGGKDFKQFNPPLAICPRFWDGTQRGFPITHPTSNYEVWQNCTKQSSANIGQVAYTITGPTDSDFGGDIGISPTIVIGYTWNGDGTTYADREELYLTQKAGWVKWTHAKLMNGVYRIDDATLHNKIVAGGPPTIQFPCFRIS